MKALLLKDFYTIKKQLEWILFILLFFTVITFISGDGMILLTLGVVFATVQVSSLFTYDEMSRWDQFVNTLPVKREDIILSKYLLTVFLTIGIIVVISAIIAIQNKINPQFTLKEAAAVLCVVIFLTTLFSSITLPLYVKFGSQKGRIALYVVIFLPIASIGFISYWFENFVSHFPSMDTLFSFAYYLPIISFLLLIISYLISVNFYKNKEF